ncbi:acylphosphatase [bacterium]|nr:acylphosphatase [bacterium]
MVKLHHIIVKGKVQGVFYRDYTQKKARSLGLKGSVRNRSDGSVEIYAQGNESQLKELESWCWDGSPYSNVVNVIAQEEQDDQHFPDFRIIF